MLVQRILETLLRQILRRTATPWKQGTPLKSLRLIRPRIRNSLENSKHLNCHRTTHPPTHPQCKGLGTCVAADARTRENDRCMTDAFSNPKAYHATQAVSNMQNVSSRSITIRRKTDFCKAMVARQCQTTQNSFGNSPSHTNQRAKGYQGYLRDCVMPCPEVMRQDAPWFSQL